MYAHYIIRDLQDVQHLVDGLAGIAGSAKSAEEQMVAYLLLAEGGALCKVLIASRGSGRIIATASRRDSEWLPHGASIQDTRRIAQGLRLLCQESKESEHDPLCLLRVQGPYELGQLFDKHIVMLVLP